MVGAVVSPFKGSGAQPPKQPPSYNMLIILLVAAIVGVLLFQPGPGIFSFFAFRCSALEAAWPLAIQDSPRWAD